MRLLIVRGDLQSHSGYSAAARDYGAALAPCFDHVVGVDIHHCADRPHEPFPYALVGEAEARRLAGQAQFALALSLTTTDHYARLPHAANVGLTFWECDRIPRGRANRMDRLWVASRHTQKAFRVSGVKVPIRLVPWPIQIPVAAVDGMPESEVHDLDQRRGTTSVRSIPNPRERLLLCVAQDVPRKALLLLLSEWLEFKRRPEAAPWLLMLKSSSADPRTSAGAFVGHFRDHVQSLKRQLGIHQAGVFLWAGDLSQDNFARLLHSTFGQVTASLGEGFCAPAALALALGKPLVASRHTALADYIPRAYPYTFATRPAIIRFARDPLGVYDPAASWHVPAPFAVADALSRLVTDQPTDRAAAVRLAQSRVLSWCDPERARRVLAEEVALLAGLRQSKIAPNPIGSP